MGEDEAVVVTTVRIHRPVLTSFKEAVMHKHGTVYRTINIEVEEALKFWTRVLNGEAKPPK